MEFRSFLTEEVYGVNAVVYHRTKSLDNIKSILAHGFKPGTGAMYGGGLYTCFALESQMNAKMDRYGPWLVKFGIQLRDFVILDYDIAKKVFQPQNPDGTPEYSLYDQLQRNLRINKDVGLAKKLNDRLVKDLKKDEEIWEIAINLWQYLSINLIAPTAPFKDISFYFYDWEKEDVESSLGYVKYRAKGKRGIVDKIYQRMKEIHDKVKGKRLKFRVDWEDVKDISRDLNKYDKGIYNKQYTAEIAKKQLVDRWKIYDHVNGIIFTGSNDGRVCVIYRPEIATMLGYANHPVDKSLPIRWETHLENLEDYKIYRRKHWDKEIEQDLAQGKEMPSGIAMFLDGKKIVELVEKKKLKIDPEELVKLAFRKKDTQLTEYIETLTYLGRVPIRSLSLNQWSELLEDFDKWILAMIKRDYVSINDYKLSEWSVILSRDELHDFLDDSIKKGGYEFTVDNIKELTYELNSDYARNILLTHREKVEDILPLLPSNVLEMALYPIRFDLDEFDLNDIPLSNIALVMHNIPEIFDQVQEGKIDLSKRSPQEIYEAFGNYVNIPARERVAKWMEEAIIGKQYDFSLSHMIVFLGKEKVLEFIKKGHVDINAHLDSINLDLGEVAEFIDWSKLDNNGFSYLFQLAYRSSGGGKTIASLIKSGKMDIPRIENITNIINNKWLDVFLFEIEYYLGADNRTLEKRLIKVVFDNVKHYFPKIEGVGEKRIIIWRVAEEGDIAPYLNNKSYQEYLEFIKTRHAEGHYDPYGIFAILEGSSIKIVKYLSTLIEDYEKLRAVYLSRLGDLLSSNYLYASNAWIDEFRRS